MQHFLKLGKIFFHRAVHFRGRVPTHWLARLEGVGGQRGNISKGQVHLKIPAPTSEFRQYRLRACAHPEADSSVLGGCYGSAFPLLACPLPHPCPHPPDCTPKAGAFEGLPLYGTDAYKKWVRNANHKQATPLYDAHFMTQMLVNNRQG